MNPGQALEDATCLQVIQVMRRMSGLDLDAIATAMDRNRQTVGCWFGEAAVDKFIPLPLVPRFCHALGTPLLIEWLVAQYERCLRDEPPQPWSGKAGVTTGLLLRGLVQAGNALELLRDMGGTLSPSQGRQVSEAALLAVATLAAAAREARGAFPVAPKHLRFDRFPLGGTDAAIAAAEPSRMPWWRRLWAWLAGSWDWAGEREAYARSLGQLHKELETCQDMRRLSRAELAETRRIMGAMGYLLREGVGRQLELRELAERLLAEGEALNHGRAADA